MKQRYRHNITHRWARGQSILPKQRKIPHHSLKTVQNKTQSPNKLHTHVTCTVCQYYIKTTEGENNVCLVCQVTYHSSAK